MNVVNKTMLGLNGEHRKEIIFERMPQLIDQETSLQSTSRIKSGATLRREKVCVATLVFRPQRLKIQVEKSTGAF
jgi:hypothetical protein